MTGIAPPASNAVEHFIAEYKATVDFSGLAKMDSEEKNSGDPPDQSSVVVGAYVQWTSQGVDQFTVPQRVAGITDDGEFAFVEGSPTGLPMAELTVVDPPSSEAGDPKPPSPAPKGQVPANPFYKPSAPDGPRIEFPLPNDNAIEIRLKKPVSKKDFERIKKLVELSEDSLVGEEGA